MNSSNVASRESQQSPSTSNESSQPASQSQESTFTALKNFASEKIGSLLQGILGLPSSFGDSKIEGRHWAVFEEEAASKQRKDSTIVEALHRSKSNEIAPDTTVTREEAPTTTTTTKTSTSNN